MTLPHNELTKKAAEELIEQWLNKQSEGLFTDQFLQELRAFYDAYPRITCIPIIPPDQEDEEPFGQEDEEDAKPAADSPREGFFEKRIKRVDGGGPPPRGKPKISPTLADLPLKSDEEIIKSKEETEAIHRAIGARPR